MSGSCLPACVYADYLPLLLRRRRRLCVQVLAAQSGKMALLDRLLKQLQPRGHKVLIFSQVRRGGDGARCCCLSVLGQLSNQLTSFIV